MAFKKLFSALSLGYAFLAVYATRYEKATHHKTSATGHIGGGYVGGYSGVHGDGGYIGGHGSEQSSVGNSGGGRKDGGGDFVSGGSSGAVTLLTTPIQSASGSAGGGVYSGGHSGNGGKGGFSRGIAYNYVEVHGGGYTGEHGGSGGKGALSEGITYSYTATGVHSSGEERRSGSVGGFSGGQTFALINLDSIGGGSMGDFRAGGYGNGKYGGGIPEGGENWGSGKGDFIGGIAYNSRISEKEGYNGGGFSGDGSSVFGGVQNIQLITIGGGGIGGSEGVDGGHGVGFRGGITVGGNYGRVFNSADGKSRGGGLW